MSEAMKESRKGTDKSAAIHIKETQQESDQKLVKGIFRCFDPKGGGVRLAYRRYRGEPIRTYDFTDGEIYEIPLGLARHLRDKCALYIHAYKLDDKGNTYINKTGTKDKRMTFEPLVFDLDGRFFS